MATAMLQPVIVLAGWTLVVLGMLMSRRFPALRGANIDLRKVVGGRGQDLDGRIAAHAQWPAHNYSHLVEQPTLFYAVALALAVVGDASPLSLGLAWAYVAVRIVHSLWQVSVNVVATRFFLFALSTLVLAALTARAAITVF